MRLRPRGERAAARPAPRAAPAGRPGRGPGPAAVSVVEGRGRVLVELVVAALEPVHHRAGGLGCAPGSVTAARRSPTAAPGTAARRTRRPGTPASGPPACAAPRPPRSRTRWRRRPCRPPAARTALKPIVCRFTEPGSEPPAARIVSSTASSEGTPVTPTVFPPRSARPLRRVRGPRRSPRPGGAGRSPRPRPGRGRARRAIPKSLMSMIAKSARPASSSLAPSAVPEGSRISRSTPSSSK